MSSIEFRYLPSENSLELDEITEVLIAVKAINRVAARVANVPNAALEVRVSPFEAGSFRLILEYALQHREEVGVMFAMSTTEVATTVKTVTGTILDLLKLTEFFKGKPPEMTARIDGGEIEVQDGDRTIRVKNPSYELYGSSEEVRKLMKDVLKPVDDRASRGLEVLEDGKKALSFSSGEIAEIRAPDQAKDAEEVSVELDGEIERRREVTELRLRSASFEADLVWRVSLDGHDFGVRMGDLAFQERASSGFETFKAGDRLKVELETIRHRGRVTERVVSRVLDHYPAQQTLEESRRYA